MRSIVIFVASVAYIGYIPVASGTWGSLAGIPLFWLFDGLSASPAVAMVAFAALVLASCWVAGKADEYLREHDSHKIVIDEVVGYAAATMFLPPSWRTALIAFLIFRVLDVVKPFPAGYVDAQVPGGYGVVLDDVVSGIYSNVLTRLVLLALPG